MLLLKIKLEASKQGHSWGGLLQARVRIPSPLAGRAGGKVGEAQSVRVKVTASCPAISQPLSHKPAAQGLLGQLPPEQLAHLGTPVSLLQLAGDRAKPEPTAMAKAT